MPMSRLRCATAYDNTPYMPVTPSPSATSAKPTSSVVAKRRRARLSPYRSVTSAMRWIGSSGSSSRTADCNAPVRLAGSTPGAGRTSSVSQLIQVHVF